MKYSIYSDTGSQKHRNEDAYLLRVATWGKHMRGMIAVCDGVSSLDDGQFASYFVIAGLNALFEDWKLHKIKAEARIREIHLALCKQGAMDHKRYGTTLSLFLFEDDRYELIQVGDSRIYLFQRKLRQLSVDQTLAQEKYDQQTISLAEYEASCERHVLTQCIGVNQQLQMMCAQGRWQVCDVVMVCSDGIFHHLSNHCLQLHMHQFQRSGTRDMAQRLAMAGLANGETDNQSAVLFTRS